MANPTRTQIEAAFNIPKYKVELEWSGTFYTVPDDHVVEISGNIRSSGSNFNGLSFGTYVEPSASVTLFRRYVISADALRSYDNTGWLKRKVRISQSFDTSDYIPIFIGVIEGFEINGEELTFNIVGILEYVRDVKLYTGATYNRPIASRTDAASIENPATLGYRAGTINRILWEAGGRPLEQRGVNYSDTDATFWYSLEQSLFSPQWTWIAGENLVDELFLLARSSGGQIYETVYNAGGTGVPVIRYVQPLTLADSSFYASFYNFGADKYSGFKKTYSGVEKVSTVRCSFTQRRLYRMQEVYKDDTARFIRAGEVKEYDLEMQLPVFEYETINSNVIKAFTNHNNRTVTLPVTVIRQNASRVTISVNNTSGYPATINSIFLRGRPLAVEEEGLVSYGSGTPVQDIEDNPYIQTYGHALRLTRMVHDFYSSYRPIITLTDSIYDPDRYVGEIVQCANDDNVIYSGGSFIQDTGLYRIIGITHSNTGANMDIELVSIAGLPDRNDMYIVNTVYASGDTRLISY